MQNFGKIKNTFNEILADGVVSKNDTNKLLFKKYIKTIKESEILRTQFLIYNNIENKIESDSLNANLYVSENIKLLDKFKVSDILKENNKLIELSSEISEKINDVYDERLSSLHESLSELIFTRKNPNTINIISEKTKNIVEFIKTNVERVLVEAIEMPSDMISGIMVDKYNAKYSTLDETERKILKSLIDSDDEKKKEVYSETLKECISLVNDKLKESDLESKERLLKVKEKLLNDTQEINEDFFTNISKLVELKSDLKNI